MMQFFSKTYQKRCRGLAICLSDIDHSEHLRSKLWLFFMSVLIFRRGQALFRFGSIFLENSCFQTIIFLSNYINIIYCIQPLGVTHKYKNQKKSEISDFSGPPPPPPPPLMEKSEPKIKKSFIAFLDTMSYDWDFKIILYFSPLKSGKDLKYFSVQTNPF